MWILEVVRNQAEDAFAERMEAVERFRNPETIRKVCGVLVGAIGIVVGYQAYCICSRLALDPTYCDHLPRYLETHRDKIACQIAQEYIKPMKRFICTHLSECHQSFTRLI